MSTLVETFKKQLLEQAQRVFYQQPISEATHKAFIATPRHLFVKRYRDLGVSEWSDVTEEKLESHLGKLYMDFGLTLFGEGERGVSAISQPSLVLRRLAE
jgi:hypothetical protein